MTNTYRDRPPLNDLVPRLLAPDSSNPVQPKYASEEAESLSIRLGLIAHGYSSNGLHHYSDAAMRDLQDVARSLNDDTPEDELNRLLRSASHFSWVQQYGEPKESEDDHMYRDQAIWSLIRIAILQQQRISELERLQPSATWELVQKVIGWCGLLELAGKFLGWWATATGSLQSKSKRALRQYGMQDVISN